MNQKGDLKSCHELTDLIFAGMDRLDIRKQETQAAQAKRQAAIAEDWKAYEEACRKALPPVLQDYMAPFAIMDRRADWTTLLVVTIKIPNLSELRVRLESENPNDYPRPTTYQLAHERCYLVPTSYLWLVDDQKYSVIWGYRKPITYNRDELDMALAQAQLQAAEAAQTREEVEQRQAQAAARAAEQEKEPVYQPVDEAVNPNPDLQMVEIMRGWIKEEVASQIAAI